jgi:hypothetical protein
VAALLPGQALILGHSTEPGGVPSQVTPQTAWGDTWAFILQPVNEQQTRLIIRSRATYADPTMRTIMTIVGPGYFIMERGMLVGIKERVERAAGIAATYTAADGWSVAFLLLALAGLVAATFRGRWPHKLILVPLGTALWVATLFVGFPSFPIAAGVALLIIGALVWDYFPVHTRRPAVMQPSA